ACPRGSTSFAVSAVGSGPLAYRWRKGGVSINTTTNPSATSASLTLANVQAADAGQYDCLVTNASGGVTSNTATLTVCVADTDNGSGTGVCDGGVGIEDLLYYLRVFDAGTARADVDAGSGTGTPDGGVGIEDLLYY